jgi:hypothetical protein
MGFFVSRPRTSGTGDFGSRRAGYYSRGYAARPVELAFRGLCRYVSAHRLRARNNKTQLKVTKLTKANRKRRIVPSNLMQSSLPHHGGGGACDGDYTGLPFERESAINSGYTAETRTLAAGVEHSRQ